MKAGWFGWSCDQLSNQHSNNNNNNNYYYYYYNYNYNYYNYYNYYYNYNYNYYNYYYYYNYNYNYYYYYIIPKPLYQWVRIPHTPLSLILFCTLAVVVWHPTFDQCRVGAFCFAFVRLFLAWRQLKILGWFRLEKINCDIFSDCLGMSISCPITLTCRGHHHLSPMPGAGGLEQFSSLHLHLSHGGG